MSRSAVPISLALAIGAALAGASAAPPRSTGNDEPTFQVTIFGVVARPGGTEVDGRLANIATALRKFRPDHGFVLRGVKSRSLSPGEVVQCPLGDDLAAEAELLKGLDPSGKVRIRFTLRRAGRSEFSTTVTTPPNQLFFCEKPLAGGSDRLLIGIGAR